MLVTVGDWKFNAFELEAATHGHPLSTLAFFLFSRANLISTFQIDGAKLARCVCSSLLPSHHAPIRPRCHHATLPSYHAL